MYLWIGCRLPQAFEQEIRQRCLRLNEMLKLDTTAFELPQHISLKISFETNQQDCILQYLEEVLSAESPFPVQIQQAVPFQNILWIPICSNPTLQRLHDLLDTELMHRFGIPQHEFDRCFQFHSTLFIDPNSEKIASMAEALASEPMERELMVHSFLLGLSESGKAGTYRVVREIQL